MIDAQSSVNESRRRGHESLNKNRLGRPVRCRHLANLTMTKIVPLLFLLLGRNDSVEFGERTRPRVPCPAPSPGTSVSSVASVPLAAPATRLVRHSPKGDGGSLWAKAGQTWSSQAQASSSIVKHRQPSSSMVKGFTIKKDSLII